MNSKGMQIQFCRVRKKKMLFHVRRKKENYDLVGFSCFFRVAFWNFFFCFSSHFLFVQSVLSSLNGRTGTKQKLHEERKQWKCDFKLWLKNWAMITTWRTALILYICCFGVFSFKKKNLQNIFLTSKQTWCLFDRLNCLCWWIQSLLLSAACVFVIA